MSRVDWYYRLQTGDRLKPDWAGVMQITVGLLGSGLEETVVQGLLLESSNVGVRYLHISSDGIRRPASTTQRMVRSAMRKARNLIAASEPFRDRGQAAEAVALIREAVESNPSRWSGRAGANDLAVMQSLLCIAQKVGRVEVSASIRQLADDAGVSLGSASRALRRLGDFVEDLGRGRGGVAGTFKLKQAGTQWNTKPVPERTKSLVFHSVPTPHAGTIAARSHDIWRRAGLGKSAWLVYSLLDAEPYPATTLAAAMGTSRRAVGKHLSRLRRNGLADYGGDGWIRGASELDAVAVRLGVAGIGQAQREIHRTQRQKRRGDQDDYVTALKAARENRMEQTATDKGRKIA